ncbi:MAG TPA: ABC transporter transmembrane domain-containing protein, partial [Acidimicrobiales bacterium]|nr:ABC transporter transmembrane domain-containing protein [Acidimicrobiales bacterium]
MAAEPGTSRRRGWIRRLLPFLAAYRRQAVLTFAAALTGLAVTALTPVIQKVIVDDVILARRRSLTLWLGVLIAAGLFRFGAAHVRRYLGGIVALGVEYDLRNEIHARLQRLDFARHDQFHTGQLVSRAISDVSLVQGLLAFFPLVSGNVLLLVMSVCVMAVLSPLLTVVALLVVPLVTVIALRLRTTVFPAAWDAQQKAGEVAGVVEESVAGVRVVKGFGQEPRAVEQLAGAAERLYGSRMRALRIQAWFSAALQAVPVLGQVAVLALGGWLALRGRISIGTFLAFSSYLLQLVSPVRMLSIFTVVAQQARAGAERIFEVLESTAVVVEREGAEPLPPVKGEIRFEGVTFGYLRSEPVLQGFDLTVAPGETVALVGPSGSGKSTVGLLVPRFYDVQEGTVRVDGADVRDVTLDSLRRQVGVVFEDTFLFSDTVKANIAYGRPDAIDEDVEAAARAAEAHEFILALPDGYATRLGEGGLSLSGGQRQRVALARALLTDPRILLLDDATSSVDARVEEEIHATLRRLLAGRTTVLVAHRRSTLQLADRIVVVEGGAVVDSGTHDELLGRSLIYRRLLGGTGVGDGELDEAAPDGVPDGDGLVTAAAWRGPDGDGAPLIPVAPRPSVGPEVGGVTAAPPRAGGRSRSLALVAETPELRAAVAALPPPADRPDVDVAAVASADAADAGKTREAGFSLRRFLRPYRRPLLGGFALVVLDAAAGLAGPALVRVGLDRGVVEGSGTVLTLAALTFLGIALADWVVVRSQQVVIGRVAERLLFALRVRIFAHLQRLGLDFYEREMAGSVMTRITTDVEALAQLLQQGLVQAVVSLLTVVGVGVVLT